MGFHSNIYEDAKKHAIESVRNWAEILLDDTLSFEEDGLELYYFNHSLEEVALALNNIADEVCVALAKDVATDLLIDDADFPQLYTDALVRKDRSAQGEVAKSIWESDKAEECTPSQVRRGVEEAWEELEQTPFDEMRGEKR